MQSINNEKLSDIRYLLKLNSNESDKLVDYDSDKELPIILDENNDSEANIFPPISHYLLP
jgi:hypothetical protein